LRSPILKLSFLAILISAIGVQAAVSQEVKSRFFLEASIESGLYSGDRGLVNRSGLSGLAEKFGPSFRLKLGYNALDDWDALFFFRVGSYPGIVTNRSGSRPIDDASSSSRRQSIGLALRRRFSVTILGFRPLASFGYALAYGRINGSRRTGAGPLIGLSVEKEFLGTTVFGGVEQHIVFPGTALDGTGKSSSGEALSALQVGVRYTFSRRRRAADLFSVAHPHRAMTGDANRFIVRGPHGSEAQSTPDVIWQFGDGDMARGMSVEHAYDVPGLYSVVVKLSTGRAVTRQSFDIEIRPRHTAVDIVALSVNPRRPRVRDTILFEPVVSGSGVSCLWSFGDGSSSRECNTSHTYGRKGKYRVRLEAKNEISRAVSSRELVVDGPVCADPPGLSSVYFRTNSADLTLEMRALLRANFSSLSSCPNRTLVIVGGALVGERRARTLASERVDVVIQYYSNLGIPSEKLVRGDPLIQKDREGESLPWMFRFVSSSISENYD
jgi:PKD domain